MNVIADRNVPQAYAEAFWKMRVWATQKETRNGSAMVTKDVFLEIYKPGERVLFDRERRANPFFHMMEFIWMMAGEWDVSWLKQFNKGIERYAEPAGMEKGKIHGAYGRRWREHWEVDQIKEIRNLLTDEPNTRRAVIGMWDPTKDLNVDYRDIPCNTHIYVTIERNGLEFTVCNRSNDLVWGMLGANAVHMTMLQQILAEELSYQMASYKVFTKDLHVYRSLPNFRAIWETRYANDPYSRGAVSAGPMLYGQTLDKFLEDCTSFIRGFSVHNRWLNRTAKPMRDAYLERINGGTGIREISNVEASDWREAGRLWVELKELASAQAEEA